MNGTKIIAISLLIGIIIGVLVTGAVGYYIFFRPTVSAIRAELDASRRDAELYRSRAERNEVIIGEVKDELNRTTEQLGSAISTIQQARDKIRTVIETLRKIREMVENKELDNGG